MSRRHAVVLVKGQGSTYLMGTRKDNGKVNFPAGGINDGEEPKAGAERELLEETGFKAKKLWPLGVYEEKDREGKLVMVYVFGAEIDGKPNLENDPDMEFQSIYWQDPFKVPTESFHIPVEKNCGLKALIKTIKG